MSSHAASTPRRDGSAPRPSLSATMLRLTAAALVAAVLLWSLLFIDLVRKRGDRAGALTQSSAQESSPNGGHSAQAPTPVTTRTS